MNNKDILYLLNMFEKENYSKKSKPKELNIDSIEIPSPIMHKNTLLMFKISNQVKESYKKLQVNKTTLAKIILNANEIEDTISSKLHFENQEFKSELKSKIISLNEDFELLSQSKSKEENLMSNSTFNIAETEIMLKLEKMWEKDVRNLDLKSMIIKWRIKIPDKIKMFDNTFVTFRQIKKNNILEYITNDGEVFEVIFSY